LEARNSVTHNALVMAHAIMNVGTTSDTFLRENLDWYVVWARPSTRRL
jgi:26S proteasome regulatory subunit N2